MRDCRKPVLQAARRIAAITGIEVAELLQFITQQMDQKEKTKRIDETAFYTKGGNE